MYEPGESESPRDYFDLPLVSENKVWRRRIARC